MDKRYSIKYTNLFYKDLIEILNYIKYELGNVQSANKLFDEIIKAVSNRAVCPKAYEKYVSTKKRKNTYYKIYVKNYIIFYIVKDNVMEVRRILYNKRNFKTII